MFPPTLRLRGWRLLPYITNLTRGFKTLEGSLATLTHLDLTNNQIRNDKMLSILQQKIEYASQGGGEKAIQRHTVKNGKLLVRERIRRLLDNNAEDFLEINQLCGLGLYGADVQCGGVVCGIGRINERDVMVVASDATVSAGAMYPITVRKQLRAQEIAQENKLPVFYIVDSAGAFLPLQSEIFADREHGGRAFYNQARMSADAIPQIAIVPGSCTAGGAYMCTMSDEAVIVKDRGYVYLGGPPLVKAATGEIVSDKELGGAEVHCELSGCTDHFADDENEALELGRSIAETLPMWKDDKAHLGVAEPLHSMDDISSMIPPTSTARMGTKKETLPIHHILSRILDGSKFHEHRARYGKTLICGFGKINGEMLGILANQGPLFGGPLVENERASTAVKVGASSSPAALKGTHFVELCNQRKIPIVFLVDIWEEPIMTTRGVGAIRDIGRMMASIANASVPKITINIGRVFGTVAYSMGGRAMGSTFVFSWPNASVSMGGTGSSNSGGGDSDGSGDESNPVRDAFYGSARVWDDGVIAPADTRKVLKRVLGIAKRKLK